MKFLILGFICFISVPSFAATKCDKIAKKSVMGIVTQNNKGWHVHSSVCTKATSSNVNLCKVSGSHVDGAGSKDFLVVMSTDCKTVYEVRLTAEE